MGKILISLPDELARRFRVAFPTRQRSKVIATLLRQELDLRDRRPCECARAVEGDQALNAEMKEWDAAGVADGPEDEAW